MTLSRLKTGKMLYKFGLINKPYVTADNKTIIHIVEEYLRLNVQGCMKHLHNHTIWTTPINYYLYLFMYLYLSIYILSIFYILSIYIFYYIVQ